MSYKGAQVICEARSQDFCEALQNVFIDYQKKQKFFNSLCVNHFQLYLYTYRYKVIAMTDTKTRILDLAEELTQRRGFNGFSYIDLANGTGIKTASVHYYFKLKDDLAAALVERIHETHEVGFANINADNKTPKKRLEAVIKVFQQYAIDQKFCLCGMMTAELQSISPRVSKLVDAYFTNFQNWLARQFKELGHENPKQQAISFLSALEGSLLLARLRNDPKLVHKVLIGYL